MKINKEHRVTTKRARNLPSASVSQNEPEDDFQSSTPLWKRVTGQLLPFTKSRERQWTVLYYGAGNNNLSRDLGLEMGGLRNAGSSDEIQIVAQLAKDDAKSTAVRGAMAKIPMRFGAVRPRFVEEEKLEADMGQEATLSDFLRWGMEKYPAKHYMVIQAGHGNGHRGSMTDEKTGSIISLPEQRSAFEQAPAQTDVLLKESCMGASLEEAYEMKDTVGYFAASQDVTSGNVDLGGLISKARQSAYKENLAPEKMVELMTGNLSKKVSTFTVVDQAALAETTPSLSRFVGSLQSEDPDRLKAAAQRTARVKPDLERLTSQNEWTRVAEEKRLQYRDSLGFLRAVQDSVGETSPASRELVDGLSKALIFHHSSVEYEEQTGLSWNISPDPAVSAGAEYKNLALAKDTGWTGVIQSRV